MPELLLPAGNLKKLKTAFHFGADAVYAGGKSLSLRAYADNFSTDELAEGIAYAHSIGKKVYVTANIVAKNADLQNAAEFFDTLSAIHADAVLIADAGLIDLCREVAPTLAIHLSTQANVCNSYAVRFWQKQGVKRIVLARELSFDEVKRIHLDVPDMQLEVFVHGAMCVGMSGRCLLSSYFTGRSSNRGECAQPCRWQYALVEKKHPQEPLIVEEDAEYTFFMNSKDLNLLSRLPALIDAGIDSFKVEGRMKSEYYVAAVAAAYRGAIDEYLAKGRIDDLAKYHTMLDVMSHRPYTEAFFNGDNPDTFSYDRLRSHEKQSFTAQVERFENGTVFVEMRNRFKTGDTLTVLSPDPTLNGMKVCVGEITLLDDMTVTDDAKLVQARYCFACPLPLEPGDILLKPYNR